MRWQACAIALAIVCIACSEAGPTTTTPAAAGSGGASSGVAGSPAASSAGAGNSGVAGSSSANGGGGASAGNVGSAGMNSLAGGGGGGGGTAGEGQLSEWPDADNTGVPAGLALTPSADRVVSQDGKVLEGLELDGSIIVKANNVVIRNCKITNDNTAIRFEEGTNLLVERVTFVGGQAPTLDGAIQAWGDITVRRIQVTGFGEGVDIYGAGGLIEDSYFHDMANKAGKLMDGIEAWQAKHLVISHNVIEMPDGNSVIKLPLDVPVPGGDDVLIENNLLAGGGYTVYGGYDPPNQNPSYTNVRFIGNRFSTVFGPKCGFYGPGAFIESELSHDNVWHESGEPLEL